MWEVNLFPSNCPLFPQFPLLIIFPVINYKLAKLRAGFRFLRNGRGACKHLFSRHRVALRPHAYWAQSRTLEVAIKLNVPTDLGAKSPRIVIEVQSFGHFMGKKSMLTPRGVMILVKSRAPPPWHPSAKLIFNMVALFSALLWIPWTKSHPLHLPHFTILRVRPLFKLTCHILSIEIWKNDPYPNINCNRGLK